MKSIMEGSPERVRGRAIAALAMLALTGSAAAAGVFDDVHFRGSGYLRESVSIGFEDHPERSAATGKRLGGSGDVIMQRHTVLLEGSADFGEFYIGAVGRFSRERMTSFLKDLQRSSRVTAAAFGGEATSFRDFYDEEDIREFYVGFNLTDRIKMTLGKQQVVWGESDGFQAMDVIHGMDFSWRFGLEGENEELRKPLILANTEIAFPELDGTLQLIYRPGWDKASDIGFTVDLFGGRWAVQPNHGVDSLALIPYNPDHSSGDTDDASYGFRWTGIAPLAGELGYSVGFYHGPKLAPIVNSIFDPYGTAPSNGFAEFINPYVDTFGASFNAYSARLDATINGELAFTPNEPFNFGFTFGGAGLDGVVEKNTVRAMLRSDMRMPKLGALLRTTKPATLILQVTDVWLPNFDRSDDIIIGGSRATKQHSVQITGVLSLNYRFDTINPAIVTTWDPTYKGGLFVPSVEWIFGDHWRLKTELAFFFHSGRRTDPDDGSGADRTHSFGQLANQNQANFRLTYQF